MTSPHTTTFDTVTLTQNEFDTLPTDPTASSPDFTHFGQQWKRLRSPSDPSKGWMRGEYIKVEDIDMLMIEWRYIEVTPTV